MRSTYIAKSFWPDYCNRIFGTELPALDVTGTNNLYKGLNIEGSNIFFTNAIEDPWRYAAMQAITDPIT